MSTFPPLSTGFPTFPFHAVGRYASEPRNGEYDSVPESCKRLAHNVRMLRAMRRWSQEELAFQADLDRSFIGGIERCERNITFGTAEKLAGAFGLTLEELLSAHRSPSFGQKLMFAARSTEQRSDAD